MTRTSSLRPVLSKVAKVRCGAPTPQRALPSIKSTGRSEEVRVIEKRVYRTDFRTPPERERRVTRKTAVEYRGFQKVYP